MRWLDRLAQPAPIVLDGATGTRLEALGVDVNNPLWSSVALLDDGGRRLTESVHREYVEAGAEVVIANSHNLSLANVERFLASAPADFEGDRDPVTLTRCMNVAAVAAARTSGALVAGCLASPDRPYATRASLVPTQVADRLEVQLVALQAGAPDLIVFEMLTTSADLEGVAEVVRRRPSSIPVAVGWVAGPRGTLGGVSWADAWAVAQSMAVTAVFVQCTPFSAATVAVESVARIVDGAAVGVYANDGGYDPEARTWTGARVTPEVYGAAARVWCSLGARIVGGCCGTGPDHIRAVGRALAGDGV